MKLTDESYFKLSQLVYDDKYLDKGTRINISEGQFVAINSINSKESGLQAVSFVPLKEYKDFKAGKTKSYNNMVFVSRGMEPAKLKDVKADVGGLPEKFDSLLKYDPDTSLKAN